MAALLIAIIYISFISLGLPDSLLGSAWPVMRIDFNVPLSYAGIVSMVICIGTIVSSLLSDRLTKKFGTGTVTAVSVTTTATALFLFSISTQFWMLIVFAIPYGLGAGGVDASLNNFVALRLKARHMSWLHCMWGVGAAVSPYIMSFALTHNSNWNEGYFIVALIQIILSACLFLSLPLWKKDKAKSENEIEKPDSATEQGGEGANTEKSDSAAVTDEHTSAVVTDENASAAVMDEHTSAAVTDERGNAYTADEITRAKKSEKKQKAVPLREVVKIKGAVECFLCFFCYCALESTAMLWASSYMIHFNGITEQRAAMFASLFFIGMTVGRGINGFLTIKFTDKTLIRAGQALIVVGLIFIVVPSVTALTIVGFITIGLGCAPVYPSIIHMTPALFGKDKSQAVIGVQMASAYVGSLCAPPLFGLLADYVTPNLLPLFLSFFLVIMVVMHEIVVIKTRKKSALAS